MGEALGLLSAARYRLKLLSLLLSPKVSSWEWYLTSFVLVSLGLNKCIFGPLFCDPQAACTGCDPAAIWNIDSWPHTNIIRPSNLLYLFSWINSLGSRPMTHLGHCGNLKGSDGNCRHCRREIPSLADSAMIRSYGGQVRQQFARTRPHLLCVFLHGGTSMISPISQHSNFDFPSIWRLLDFHNDFGMLKFRDLGDILLPVFNDK